VNATKEIWFKDIIKANGEKADGCHGNKSKG
jgi:hypothetical protein